MRQGWLKAHPTQFETRTSRDLWTPVKRKVEEAFDICAVYAYELIRLGLLLNVQLARHTSLTVDIYFSVYDIIFAGKCILLSWSGFWRLHTINSNMKKGAVRLRNEPTGGWEVERNMKIAERNVGKGWNKYEKNEWNVRKISAISSFKHIFALLQFLQR